MSSRFTRLARFHAASYVNPYCIKAFRGPGHDVVLRSLCRRNVGEVVVLLAVAISDPIEGGSYANNFVMN
jgi:hypothetical protein